MVTAGQPKRTRLIDTSGSRSRQGVHVLNNGEFGKAARGPVDRGARAATIVMIA